jgi:hypothetical protein
MSDLIKGFAVPVVLGLSLIVASQFGNVDQAFARVPERLLAEASDKPNDKPHSKIVCDLKNFEVSGATVPLLLFGCVSRNASLLLDREPHATEFLIQSTKDLGIQESDPVKREHYAEIVRRLGRQYDDISKERNQYKSRIEKLEKQVSGTIDRNKGFDNIDASVISKALLEINSIYDEIYPFYGVKSAKSD